MMDVLANLNAFMQYSTLPQDNCDIYMSTLKLVMPKLNLMAWVRHCKG